MIRRKKRGLAQGLAEACETQSVARASRLPRAHIAQSVEHFLGKEEVTGSNPVMGSILSGIGLPVFPGNHRPYSNSI